ncbi:MAG: IS630 family transposase [Acidobacteria bacterium]|nr:IS630 family transposase [Acidobacteriota bacterium]MCA1628544.1 IS630 family transposase [Acidobacteriota bacterium]
MKTATRFIKSLSQEQQRSLNQIMRSHPSHRTRTRAHAILLSARHYSINQIADIFVVDRETVTSWLVRWEESQTEGLDDDPKSGRPSTLSDEEEKQAIEIVKEEPRSLKQQLLSVMEKFGKKLSLETLRNLCKRHGLSWRRIRRSLKGLRDETLFRQAKDEVEGLKEAHRAGLCDLYYFDEAGFMRIPAVGYAWQEQGTRIEVTAQRSVSENVLGFLSLDCQFHPFVFRGAIDAAVVIDCFDAFSRLIDKETWVVIDNAPTHISEEFEDELEQWAKRGLHLYFLPAYCPELNLIEHLWRKIKYEWLPLSAFESNKAFAQALDNVLSQVGSKYQITFS